MFEYFSEHLLLLTVGNLGQYPTIVVDKVDVSFFIFLFICYHTKRFFCRIYLIILSNFVIFNYFYSLRQNRCQQMPLEVWLRILVDSDPELEIVFLIYFIV